MDSYNIMEFYNILWTIIIFQWTFVIIRFILLTVGVGEFLLIHKIQQTSVGSAFFAA